MACRMMRRDVERIEVVPLGIDFRSLGDLIAHSDEDVLEMRNHDRERIRRAAWRAPSGHREVDAIGGEQPLLKLARNRRLTRCNELLERTLELVAGRPDDALL